ncbi:M4 family metallopeptidase [Kutzneria sp. CA-103260]|uniref:M4 family metallopeptidase n=1 Tax=Kutzneria sp. CA-103260 TaxID=2802641 RepID=UPI001BA58C33|nr:M4 family metallopeptidase [Kutzneria sp. CA-103260]QUQ64744.1 peptidase M4 [Kutzneria sp. CA-103260]
MKRVTLCCAAAVTVALASTVAGFATATAAPANPLLARQEALQSAQDQAPSLAGTLGLGSQEKLVVKDVVTDSDGTRHLRYDRTYNGMRVLGGDLIVDQTAAGSVRGVTYANSARIAPAATPKLSANTAASEAAASVTGSNLAKSAPQLVVYAVDTAPTLAYETVVTGLKADQTPIEQHVFTDAASGRVLYSYDGIEEATGTGNTEYSGTVSLTTTQSGSSYQLKDGTRGNQQVNNLNHGTSTGTLVTSTNNVFGDGKAATANTAAADAAYGAAETWDFYKNTFGRNGIKNDGVGALSKVHYSNSYVNAFWSDACFCMTYGDGQNNARPLTALDVAGHEMSHGVTSATAGLVYSGESGGLNEGTSDIFGTMVEWYAKNASDQGDYLIGEKIDIFGNGKPLRYMDQPSKDGNSADYWSSTVGNKDVHYSSGVANHFFYLLAEGSGAKTINGVAYNSPTSNGQAVTGIGRDKAAAIWFRALTTKFTSTTNYSKARAGTLAAASDLYGATSAEYKAVAAAWSGVNVN